MKIQKLADGTLLIPKRIESENSIGDTVEEIKTDHADYGRYLEQFNREQQFDKEMSERLGKIRIR